MLVMKNKYLILILTFALLLNGCGSDSIHSNAAYTSDNTNSSSEYISNSNCDKIINKSFSTGQTLTICYDYLYRSAKYVNYTLNGSYVDDGNINDRPGFYTEDSIPNEYQVSPTDYMYSGYDRGHLAPDASFDYNEEDLYLIYTMANIIPQDPNVNRYFWIKAENYEREMAISLGEVEVLNGVVFESNPTYINNKIAISKGFWKRIRNTNKGFERCFYYDNFVLFDAGQDTLDKHEVDCSSL